MRKVPVYIGACRRPKGSGNILRPGELGRLLQTSKEGTMLWLSRKDKPRARKLLDEYRKSQKA